MSAIKDAFRFCGLRWLKKPQAAAKLRYLCTHSPDIFAAWFFPGRDAGVISREMIEALTDGGFYFEEFFLYDLAGKSPMERRAFISERSRFSYYRRLSPRRYLSFFHDKYKVWKEFSEDYRRDILPIRHSTSPETVRDFLRRHSDVVIKPCNASCGSGVCRFTAEDKDIPSLAETLIRRAKHGKLLCEEALRQDGFLQRANPSSLNTLRAVTVLTRAPRGSVLPRVPDNASGISVRLFHPFLRFGRAGLCVDNAGAGGIVVEIDPVSGALGAVGRDESGRSYRAHPDSHVVFGQYSLPEWDAALALLSQLALRFPECRCVGWDLAYTADRGWVMIEANLRGQMIGQQMVSVKGVAAELEALTENW